MKNTPVFCIIKSTSFILQLKQKTKKELSMHKIKAGIIIIAHAIIVIIIIMLQSHSRTRTCLFGLGRASKYVLSLLVAGL